MALATVTPADPADAGSASSMRQTAWRAVLLVALIVMAAGTVRLAFSPLQEAAKADLGLSDYQIGLVQGLAAALPMALIAIPLGWLTDHTKRTRLIFILGLTWTAGMIGTAFAQSFEALFVARMLAGLGSMSVVPVAISVLADLSLPQSRGRAMLFLSMGNTLGPALAFVAGGAMFTAFAAGASLPGIELSAWRETALVFGIASALLMLPQFFLREPARHEVEDSSNSLHAMMRALWARRRFLAPLFVGQISVIMADAAAGVWAVPVLQRDLGQSAGTSAALVGGLLLFAGVIGPVIGGFVADRGHKSSVRGGILIGAVVASAIGVPAALFPIFGNVPAFTTVLFLLLSAGAVTGLITATSIAVLIPNEERGVCLGAFMILGALIGLGLSPVLVSLGSQALGGEAHLAPALAIVGVTTSLLSLAGFVLALRNAPDKPVV